MLLQASKVVRNNGNSSTATAEQSRALIAQIKTYTVDAQIRFASPKISLGAVDEMDESVCMTIRTARDIDAETLFAWLCMHIAEVNKCINVDEKNKMDKTQQALLATSILNNMQGLNLIEICVFFARLREGRYGKFYNRFDNTQFETWKNCFMAELNLEIAAYQAAMEPIRRQEEENKRREGKSEEELLVLTGDELLEWKKKAGLSTLSIKERIDQSRKFQSSRKRKQEETHNNIPTTPDGRIDCSKEAYEKTLKEILAK